MVLATNLWESDDLAHLGWLDLSIKDECLRHFVFFGQRHLRYVISEYMAHYHRERFHQGIGSSLVSSVAANDNSPNGEIRCRSRLGELLNFYYREAA